MGLLPQARSHTEHSKMPDQESACSENDESRRRWTSPRKGKPKQKLCKASAVSPGSSCNESPSSANGIPCWEHPGKEDQNLRFPTVASNDTPPKNPKRQTSKSGMKPISSKRRSPVKKSTAVREERRAPPNFENLEISLTRQDSLTSLGDLTFDGSVAYDEHYQQQEQKRINHMALIAERSRRDDLLASGSSRPPQCPRKEVKAKSGKSNISIDDGSPTKERRGRKNDSDFAKMPLANSKSEDSVSAGALSREEPGQRPKPKKKKSRERKTREAEALESLEASGLAAVSLSHLYGKWKEQNECASNNQTKTSRASAQVPAETDYSDNSNVSCQDDASYIFGAEASDRASAHQMELQEQELIDMALQRSLEDFSCSSSVSGYSLNSMESFASSQDTGRKNVMRGKYGPSSPTDLSGAGCHLAMVASQRKPSAGSMLLNVGDESDEDEDLAYTCTPGSGATFVWERDAKTNRWYKKPVAVAATSSLSPDKRSRMLEVAKRELAKKH